MRCRNWAEVKSFRTITCAVGQITHSIQIPQGYKLEEQRLDETAVGEGTAVTLIDALSDLRSGKLTVAKCGQAFGWVPPALRFIAKLVMATGVRVP
jgi:hypothetical protein